MSWTQVISYQNQSYLIVNYFFLAGKAEPKGKKPVPKKTADKAPAAEEKKAPTKATEKAQKVQKKKEETLKP